MNEPLKRAIQQKNIEQITSLMVPLVQKQARIFAATKTVSKIELEDYIQEGFCAILQAWRKFRPTGDANKDTAHFLRLCQLKVFTCMCVFQHKQMYPLHVPMPVSILAHKAIKNRVKTHKKLIEIFGASEKNARDAIALLKSSFLEAGGADGVVGGDLRKEILIRDEAARLVEEAKICNRRLSLLKETL